MVILEVFKVFLEVKNLEIFIQIVPDSPIYYYLLDDEIFTDKKRCGKDYLYLPGETLRLLAQVNRWILLQLPKTLIISRNSGGTKTDNRNLTDLTFSTSQNTSLFNSNGSKDDNRNLTVLTAPSSQDIPVNRDSHDNNIGKN